jgi:hypothetical protein
MLSHKRLLGVGVFAVATVVVSGIALAVQPSGSAVPASPSSPVAVAPVPAANSLPPIPTVDERLDLVVRTSDPGPQRDRMVLATRLGEIGPGGSRDADATRNGAGIAGIAIGADGLFVALTSEGARAPTQRLVEQEINAILVAHPELRGFGTVTYAVKDLRATDQATPGH